MENTKKTTKSYVHVLNRDIKGPYDVVIPKGSVESCTRTPKNPGLRIVHGHGDYTYVFPEDCDVYEKTTEIVTTYKKL